MISVSRVFRLVFVVACVGTTRIAYADPATCADVYVDVQTLRRDGRLADAQTPLERCIQLCTDDTPVARRASVRCQEWRIEDKTHTPQLVVRIKDRSDNDVTGVDLVVDDAPVTEDAAARGLQLNIGVHTLVVTGRGVRETRKIVLADSERRVVSVTIVPPSTVESTAAPAKDGVVAPPAPRAIARVATGASGPPALRILGYVTGSVGILSLGIGSAFGIRALSFDGDAVCDSSNVCENPEARRDAQKSGSVATVGFLVGGTLVAGGLAMVVLSPGKSTSRDTTSGVRIVPWLNHGEGGFLAAGAF